MDTPLRGGRPTAIMSVSARSWRHAATFCSVLHRSLVVVVFVVVVANPRWNSWKEQVQLSRSGSSSSAVVARRTFLFRKDFPVLLSCGIDGSLDHWRERVGWLVGWAIMHSYVAVYSSSDRQMCEGGKEGKKATIGRHVTSSVESCAIEQITAFLLLLSCSTLGW